MRNRVPLVTLADLELAGLGVPGFVRNRIESELNVQFQKAEDLPLFFDEILLEEGRARVTGRIRAWSE